jgi:hypothetical protein
MSLFRRLSDLGITSEAAYLVALVMGSLSMLIWMGGGRGRGRGAAERRALFVGIWSPTLMLIGRGLEDAERTKTIVG